MPEGGTLTIETKLKFLDDQFPEFGKDDKSGQYVMMAVSDTGNGMDKEILARIFDPFFTTKEKGQGTGLGLSTAYGIVKQHNGYLWTYSELGQGTTFKVYLPPSEKLIKTRDLQESPAVPIRGEETILVVEDQEQVLVLAKHILESCGYNVLEAGNAKSAIEIVHSFNHSIELLLTDVVMPDLNGKELYKSLVTRLPDLKVLFMSGYTDNVIVHHGIMDKDVNFISKPFGVNDLANKVREVLDV